MMTKKIMNGSPWLIAKNGTEEMSLTASFSNTSYPQPMACDYWYAIMGAAGVQYVLRIIP
jgi:hypothetical protein